MPARYKRVLLKLSGEMLCSPDGFAVEAPAAAAVVAAVRDVIKLGVQVGLVVGAGNFIRGRDLASNPHIHRTTADYMGMLATIINGLALRDTLAAHGLAAVVMSPIGDARVCEPFVRERAIELMDAGSVVIFAGGTGSPFFTTDTCAALRAAEVGADVLLKATKVDGVFDSDPAVNKAAKKYDRLTYDKVLADRLGVMDLTAVELCRASRIPIVVFALARPGSLVDAVSGKRVGTIVSD
ncbi:MAG: UMP kinase [Phycisphaerae bacterium]